MPRPLEMMTRALVSSGCSDFDNSARTNSLSPPSRSFRRFDPAFLPVAAAERRRAAHRDDLDRVLRSPRQRVAGGSSHKGRQDSARRCGESA
jgi:hypothetical protein